MQPETRLHAQVRRNSSTTIHDACDARMTGLLNLSEFLLTGYPVAVENLAPAFTRPSQSGLITSRTGLKVAVLRMVDHSVCARLCNVHLTI